MLGKATKARRKQNKTLRQLRHLTHICKRGSQKLLLVQTKRYFGEQSKAIVNLVNGMERREKTLAIARGSPPNVGSNGA